MQETTIVRNNLMNNVNYRPYCGSNSCQYSPRTQYRPIDGQFICPHCKWISEFPEDFVKRYKEKHKLT